MMNNPLISSTQDAISDCEHRDHAFDSLQNETLFKLSEMLEMAMANKECMQMLNETHMDMRLKHDRIGESFLESLK